MVACWEKHSVCIVDGKRSIRHKYVWKLLELQRSLVRMLHIIEEVYYLPLKSRHSLMAARARPPPGATIPFVPDADILGMHTATIHNPHVQLHEKYKRKIAILVAVRLIIASLF